MSKKIRIVKLWQSFEPPYTVGVHGFNYYNICFDSEGWANAQVYLPEPYELVYLKIGRRHKMGWWDGKRWDGYRIKYKDKILYWKKFPDD